MAERSLKVLDSNKTFFGKLSNTISKILVPTKIGINGIVITLKRNNVLKYYEAYEKLPNHIEDSKRNEVSEKYEEAYSLYLEAVDKHIMDTVYKKVKNNSASEFEQKAMAEYYMITNLKNTDYTDYKYRKQKYLIELDYESLKVADKSKILNKYKGFYISKMDIFYKGILKNYSVAIAETTKKAEEERQKVFDKIFDTIDEYMTAIMPLKLENDEKGTYSKILKDYESYEKYEVGKLSEKDEIEKRVLLLNMSRVVFTHSLPLAASEKCYEKIINDARMAISNNIIDKKKQEIYEMLLDILKDFYENLLAGKVYWEDLKKKESFKSFWDKYEKAKNDKDREILTLKYELRSIDWENKLNETIINFYKDKLIKMGAMRTLKNICTTYENCKGRKIKEKVR